MRAKRTAFEFIRKSPRSQADFLAILETHEKHSEMSLVLTSGPRKMRFAMNSRNACLVF
jgi:hypothetical protein